MQRSISDLLLSVLARLVVDIPAHNSEMTTGAANDAAIFIAGGSKNWRCR